MYCYTYGDDQEKKILKGIKRSTLNNITFEFYKNILLDETCTRHVQHSIISKKHQLQTIMQNKVSLSCFYDKKFILSDNVNSFCYGHYKIKNS